MFILTYKLVQYSKLKPTASFRLEFSIRDPLKSRLFIEFPHVLESLFFKHFQSLFAFRRIDGLKFTL